jgi:hypothetical protein
MEIALIITGGVVLSVFFGSLFDFLAKKKKKSDKINENKIKVLEQKLAALEARILDKDERIDQLEHEITFINKLITDNSKK